MATVEEYISYLAESNADKNSLLAGFTTSFLTILVSEIGDKTFFIAMIMATRYNELIVFFGAYGALFLMTIISTIFGKLATSWLSPTFTNVIVTILFFYFGIKMIYESTQHVDSDDENEEMKEVEQELQEMEQKFIETHSSKNDESQLPTPESPTKKTKQKSVLPNSYVLSQSFIMTFLAEWGDRSQIATIALAASFNPYMVTAGALLGHFLCTAGAVKLGQFISGKVSEKTILLVGGIVFIISGILTLIMIL